MPGPNTPQPDMSKGPNTPSASVGGGPLTPSSSMGGGDQMPPKYTGPNTPNTPNSVSDMNFPVPSPQNSSSDKHRMTPSGGGGLPPGGQTPTSVAGDSKFPAPSPGAGPKTPMDNSRFPVPSPNQMGPGSAGPPGRFPGGPMGGKIYFILFLNNS